MDDSNSTIHFCTHFRRPSLFRFEWTHAFRDRYGRDRTTHELVMCDGKQVYTRDHNGTAEKQSSLSLAIAGATGISFGAAHTVPVMLIEEVGGFLLEELEELTVSERPFEGIHCYSIEQRFLGVR
jgi:hypothetical protein